MAAPVPPAQIEALRTGWLESVESTIAIGRTLTEEQWSLPSPCPGWQIKDLISHLTGIEEFLLDETSLTAPLDYSSEKPWIKNDFGRYNEVAVGLRRARRGEIILAEFEEVVAARNAAWLTESRDPGVEITFAPIGTLTLGHFLWRRVFDCWAHNQDLRTPLGLRGDLDGQAAALVYRQVAKALPMVLAKKCAATGGSSAVIEVTGVGGFTYGAKVNDQGFGEALAETVSEATTTIRLSTHDWYLLTCGREGRESVVPVIYGDQDLAQKLLGNFVITP